MNSTDYDFLIIYATQTNTAKYAAEELGREALRRELKTRIYAFDEYNIFNLPQEKLVVFVIATTGDGDPPTTMINSWKFLLRKDIPPGSLKNLNFTVFGLGDSTYDKFNAMAKKLTQRLLDLGANLFHKVGLGDYQHDFEYEGEFDPWVKLLWEKLQEQVKGKFIKTELTEQENDKLLPSTYKVQVLGEAIDGYSTLSQLPAPNGAINKQVYLSKVKSNVRITAEDHFQDTRHIVLSLPDEMAYEPGDVIMVQPRNNPSDISQFIEKYGLKPHQLLKIELNQDQIGQISQSSVIKFPLEGITVQELFEFWLNLMDPPSRYFVKTLSFFVEDKQKAEKLKEFASKTSEGKSEYYRYCVREKRTIPEIMHDFGITDQFPLEYLIQLAGRQKPREFSISSYLQAHKNEAHLTMAVTEYQTQFKRKKLGVCSTWLAKQEPEKGISEFIPVWLEKGTMKIPQINDGKTYPIIMVGPGTGIAAFRSFIEYLSKYPSQKQVLIFGCRSSQKDFYYQDQWKTIADLTVITAFSREQDNKVYVQHQIRNEGKSLSKLILEEGAYIYVSGKAKNMPKSVEKAFVDIISAERPEIDAKQYVLDMRKNGRYQQEVW